MKQIRRRTALLAAAALCWGILFPEYVFTPDSYTAFVYEMSDPFCLNNADEMTEESVPDGVQIERSMQNTEDIQELYEAVGDGKVCYRLGLIEYLKKYLFGT